MTTPNTNTCPSLAFALWALRKRMEKAPDQTIILLKQMGFISMELAAFFDHEPNQLVSLLKHHQIEVCGIHGPSLNRVRWLRIFETVAHNYVDAIHFPNYGVNEQITNTDKSNIASDIAGLFASKLFGISLPKRESQIAEEALGRIFLECPSIFQNTLIHFHVAWAKTYSKLFDTKTVGIQSVLDLFECSSVGKREETYAEMVRIVHGIAKELSKDGIRLSYHWFPHDGMMVKGQPLFETLFIDAPSNLGLQLDTHWLYEAGVDINRLLKYPIHSVHVHERDAEGNICPLGTDPNKCLRFVKSIAASARGEHVQWILECDTRESASIEGNIIGNINNSWLKHWPQLGSYSFMTTKSETTPQEKRSAERKMRDASLVCANQIKSMRTEHLLGENICLPFLDINYPNVNYYVKDRFRSGRPHVQSLSAEEHFYDLFWPSTPREQLIHLEGGAGSGKSTFIKFFFQYYMPYRKGERALRSINDPPDNGYDIHLNDAKRHILVYADLRHAGSTDNITFRRNVYSCLAIALSETLKYHSISGSPFPVSTKLSLVNAEYWVDKCVSWLASQTEGDRRKYYVSWIMDNADQLTEQEHKELVNIMLQRKYLLSETSQAPPHKRISDGENMLWRIIIPVRPETIAGLPDAWIPVHNRFIFQLDPIIGKEFEKTRGLMLARLIKENKCHVQVEIITGWAQGMFDTLTPDEVSEDLYETWRSCCMLGDIQGGRTISSEAKILLDNLCGDSARMRLNIYSKIAFSRPFRERKKLGIARRWKNPPLVTDRFLFYGLLCDEYGFPDIDTHTADGPLPLCNAYKIGSKADSAHSMFAGLHTLYLLDQGKTWDEVKQCLQDMQYPLEDIKSCEECLLSKRILKRQVHGGIWIERAIAQGHWQLLQEPVYTEVMAADYALSIQNQSQDTAIPTDPVDAGKIIQRVSGAIWFLWRIWESEKSVFSFRESYLNKEWTLLRFRDVAGKWRFPSITLKIAHTYLERMEMLPEYPVPLSEIQKEKDKWNESRQKLEILIEEARARVANSIIMMPEQGNK